MNAGLAGVIVPTVALWRIAAIPYFDRSPLGVGILGTSAKGRKIIGFTTVFTTVVVTVMIVADEIITPNTHRVGHRKLLIKEQGGSELIYNHVYPLDRDDHRDHGALVGSSSSSSGRHGAS